MDDSQGEIGSCTSTSLLSDLPRDERWSMDEWITLASSLGHECELLVRFHWEIEPHLVPDLPRILRITVLSGRQLAQAERYGENNPYVRVTVLGKTQQTETVREGGSMPTFADGKGEVFDWEVSDLKRAAKVKLWRKPYLAKQDTDLTQHITTPDTLMKLVPCRRPVKYALSQVECACK